MFNKIIKLIKASFGSKADFDNVFCNEPNENNSNAVSNVVNSKSNETNNKGFRFAQKKFGFLLLGGVVIGLTLLVKFVQEKVEAPKEIAVPQSLKHELADKAFDPEKMWRNHYEDELKKKTDELNNRMEKAESSVEETKAQLISETKNELAGVMEQLRMAKLELSESNKTLQDVTAREQERINAAPAHVPSSMDSIDFSDDVELDMPKSAADYVPEGTFFTGYLLGGIIVSTALNTPDENATPLTIRLKGRGNLAPENQTDISKCRIMGSAYGDLSSERAVIRLEKMICEEDGMYITSHIAGDVHGPDGFNGIKGTVISTSTKHIKNAMLGGVISGLSSSAKGQDGMSVSSGGLISTKKKGFKDMATGGVLSGVSNAGDKIADYYLRQAEAMSPVLTIPGGVRINAHITKGFFMGEVSTHRKIKSSRNKGSDSKNNSAVRPASSNEISENGSDEGWK